MSKHAARLAVQRLVVLAAAALLAACEAPQQEPESSDVIFVDTTEVSGLSHQHHSGVSDRRTILEMMGPGVGLIDFDSDGDLDLFLTQGHDLFDRSQTAPSDQLFRNDRIRPDGTPGPLTWTDVTAQVGIDGREYGMGVGVGDFDQDGHPDLFVANYGRNRLWLNDQGERFVDATSRLPDTAPLWSTSVAVVDYDRDGLLDIYIANYVDFKVETHSDCYSETGAVDYCGPQSFRPVRDRLLRNLGDARFVDVTETVGIQQPGTGLGVIASDLNGDGWPDLYVANDLMANDLWINQGDGTFSEEGLMRGSAVNLHGQMEASMGIDAGDFDNDGDMDLFMTHLLEESNTLFVNDGAGVFEDRTAQLGLSAPSVGFTGFGTNFADFDNDGWLDLVAINGEVRIIRSQLAAGIALPLQQPNQLFMGSATGFRDRSEQEPALQVLKVSRGSAMGDLDNDGDLDLIVTNTDDETQVLINQAGQDSAWIGVEPIDQNGLLALGSQVRVSASGRTFFRESGTDASYLASNDPRVLIGLGPQSDAVSVTVTWPRSGVQETWTSLAINQYHRLVEGEGALVP